MDAKERVHAALRKQPVDRVPIYMWFHPETRRTLAKALDIPPACVGEAMGDDIRQTWVGNNYPMEGIVHEKPGESHVDVWGVEWVREGSFNQIRKAPLESAGRGEILSYEFPYDRIDELLDNMESVVKEANRFFIGCDVSPCVFEMTTRLRGMEHALMDLVEDEQAAGVLLDKSEQFSRVLCRKACDRFPLDWLWLGDDAGGQHGMMMSPDLWRDVVKERLKRIVEVVKACGVWVAFHSCGAIRPIIPDLVEIGVDVLNPIQRNCPGMEPCELKAEFGADLSFMGGVDTQGLLPRGSVKDVRKATRELLDCMTADGGGYILAASHTVPPETPLENIFAMYAEAGVTEEEIRDRAGDIRSVRGERKTGT